MQICPSLLLLLLLLLLLGVASPLPLLPQRGVKEVGADRLCPEGWHMDADGCRCVVEIPTCLRQAGLRKLSRFCRFVQGGSLRLTTDGIVCATDVQSTMLSTPPPEDMSDTIMKRVFGNMGLGL